MATLAPQETLTQKLGRIIAAAYPGSVFYPASWATDDSLDGYLVWEEFGAEPASENRAELDAILARELSAEEQARIGTIAFWHPGRWELYQEEKHHS